VFVSCGGGGVVDMDTPFIYIYIRRWRRRRRREVRLAALATIVAAVCDARGLYRKRAVLSDAGVCVCV
jgi:hypothetical protein